MRAALQQQHQARVAPASGCTLRQPPRRAPAPARADPVDEPPAPSAAMGWLWDAKAQATKAKLAAIAAKPKKSLGQNFVTDDSILARIVRESGVAARDLVLEVGPGTGNLTKHLLQVRRWAERTAGAAAASAHRRAAPACRQAPLCWLLRKTTRLQTS